MNEITELTTLRDECLPLIGVIDPKSNCEIVDVVIQPNDCPEFGTQYRYNYQNDPDANEELYLQFPQHGYRVAVVMDYDGDGMNPIFDNASLYKHLMSSI